LPSTICSVMKSDDALFSPSDNHDDLHDISDIDASIIICTSCIDLRSEVEALKLVRDDMSAKLVEHNDMSARLEIEVDLLRITYAKCIEEQMESLRNAPCGTCDRLEFENEFLSKRCKSLSAKSFDSHNPCHSDVAISEVVSLQPELGSSIERESSDSSTRAISLNCSSVPCDKLLDSSNDAQLISKANGTSSKNGTHSLKEKYHCTFCKRDGHIVEFCFRHVKHERRVRAKAFRKSRSLSHGTCDSKLGTKLRVDISCSRSQGTSHLNENGNSSSRTVPADRPLYHCSFCEKDGHQERFCYRHVRRMRRARASKSFCAYSLSHVVKTGEPSTRPRFIDGFFDSFSGGLVHARRCASNAPPVGLRHDPCGASVGSSLNLLGGHCLFARDCTHSSPRVARSRHASEGDLKVSHWNQHLHHANPFPAGGNFCQFVPYANHAGSFGQFAQYPNLVVSNFGQVAYANPAGYRGAHHEPSYAQYNLGPCVSGFEGQR